MARFKNICENMLTLDHFDVARSERCVHVSTDGVEKVCIPVYYVNHFNPVNIGCIGEDSIPYFDSFDDTGKLEVLINLLELSGVEELA